MLDSLLNTHPNLAAEFHPTLNGELKAQHLTAGSNKKVWWACNKYQHAWQASANLRTGVNKSGCPGCSGRKAIIGFNDLPTTHPNVAAEFHPTLNGELKAQDLVAGSDKKPWWQCKQHQHAWQASVDKRTRNKRGCPFCSNQRVLIGFNDLPTTHPNVAAEFHPTLNGELKAENFVAGSGKKVWWLSETCGHAWEAVIKNRATKKVPSGCPACAFAGGASVAEAEISKLLTKWNITHETSNRSILNGSELDIYVPSLRIAIEYNGIYWHTDAIRKNTQFHYNKWMQCQQQGIRLIQIWEDDWNSKREAVMAKLEEVFNIDNNLDNTKITSIDLLDAETFTGKYNLTRTDIGTYNYGLTDEYNNIKAILSFDYEQDKQIHIKSYTMKNSTTDSFGRLLDFIQHKYAVNKITAILDNAHDNPKDYINNNFVENKTIEPDFTYSTGHKRIDKDSVSDMTNKPRIWNSGHTVYIKSI